MEQDVYFALIYENCARMHLHTYTCTLENVYWKDSYKTVNTYGWEMWGWRIGGKDKRGFLILSFYVFILSSYFYIYSFNTSFLKIKQVNDTKGNTLLI